MSNFWLGSIFPFRAMLQNQKLPVIIPLYHTAGFHHFLPHTRFLYRNKTETDFSHDLDFLLKHYEPVHIQDLLDINSNRKKYKKPLCHITVDDGLASNQEIMAPILYKKGVPASFFINPAFLDDKAIMHRYKASLLLDWLQRKKSEINLLSDLLKIPPRFEMIKNLILDTKYLQRKLLDDCVEKLGITWEELLYQHPLYLSTKQVHNLTEAGFHIGAHSWDHPEYGLLSLEEQKNQTLNSLLYIKQHFNPDITSFAFPFTDAGVSNEFFEWLNQQVDISFGCAGLKLDSNPRHFQRIPVEKYTDRVSGIILKQTGLFYAKKIVGKHIVKHD